MSTSTHPDALRNGARVAVPVLLVCALVLLSGCLPVPEGKTPGVGTAKVEVTRSVSESGTTGGEVTPTPRSAVLSTAPVPISSPATTAGSTSATTAAPAAKTPASCEPSGGPDVFAMSAPQTGAVEPAPICITGFSPDAEVELWVTDPDAELEYFNVLTDAYGTARVDWSAAAGFLTGTYTFEATQGDLRAIGSIDVEPAPELQEPAPESQEPAAELQEPAAELQQPTAAPQAEGPWIEVHPAEDAGGSLEVALGGFEPYQEVLLTLYVATDESGLDYQEVDSLYQPVDAQGEATFPLELTPADYPSSWFALAYFLEDGTSVYAPFQVK